ncbi:hypothetical protein IF1G_07038 [Cordyceps javanica]|uniref:Uncharacterized protein n=1 Tax=Cordyceps javanica TaxID=43265 RepID=A0A545UXH0_9HYPO|nr:hypothetical protein IF1G_07038 [Cordyceps javanica]
MGADRVVLMLKWLVHDLPNADYGRAAVCLMIYRCGAVGFSLSLSCQIFQCPSSAIPYHMVNGSFYCYCRCLGCVLADQHVQVIKATCEQHAVSSFSLKTVQV